MYFWSISEDSYESLSMESVINSVMNEISDGFQYFLQTLTFTAEERNRILETEYCAQEQVHNQICLLCYQAALCKLWTCNIHGSLKSLHIFYIFSFVHVCLGCTYMCIFVCAWIQSLEVDVGCCSWWISILYWGRVSYFNSGGTMGITCLSFQWTVITGMLPCQPGIWMGTKGLNSGPQVCFGKHITLPCTKFAFLSRNQRLVCCTQFRDCTFGFIALEN